MFRVFSGDVRTVDHVRKDADWETVFKLGDGERAWQFALTSVSFSPGAKASDAIRSIARSMGLGMGNVENQIANIAAVFDQGYAAHGKASRALDQVMKSIRMPWSVQDGELQFLPEDKSLELDIPDITPESGLIGSPEMGCPPTKKKPQLLKFKSLLVATKPGANVFLTSKRYPKSKIRVHACKFEGDTHGGDWETEIAGTISQ